MLRFARRETEPGFGICAPCSLEIRCRFSLWSTIMRCREQHRWGHHGGGTKVDPSPAKPNPRTTETLSRTPYRLCCWGNLQRPRNTKVQIRNTTTCKNSYKTLPTQTRQALGARLAGPALLCVVVVFSYSYVGFVCLCM
jgi:hypothetical protein